MPIAILGLWLAFTLSPASLGEVLGEIVLVYSCFVWFLASSAATDNGTVL